MLLLSWSAVAKIRPLYLGYVVVFEKLAERSLNLMGWEIDNHCPLELDQYVMIAAPHTSNWDALYARLGLKALGVNVRLTIKDSYMKLPFGPFVRAMGGIGIDRRPKAPGEARPSMVQLMTDLFKTHPKLVMLVTPEATRARQEQWKTGFYHIAKTANVPIVLAYCDYDKKRAGISKIVEVNDRPLNDILDEIEKFYENVGAKYPELYNKKIY